MTTEATIIARTTEVFGPDAYHRPEPARGLFALLQEMCWDTHPVDRVVMVPAGPDVRWRRLFRGSPVCFISLDGQTRDAPTTHVLIYLGPRRELFAETFADFGSIRINGLPNSEEKATSRRIG